MAKEDLCGQMRLPLSLCCHSATLSLGMGLPVKQKSVASTGAVWESWNLHVVEHPVLTNTELSSGWFENILMLRQRPPPIVEPRQHWVLRSQIIWFKNMSCLERARVESTLRSASRLAVHSLIWWTCLKFESNLYSSVLLRHNEHCSSM